MKKRLKYSLLLFVVGLMFIPLFLAEYGIFRIMPLNGYFQHTAPPEFSIKSWLAGSYQDQYSRNIDDSLALKPALVRMNNQLDFSLFRILHAERLVCGKEDYLFSAQYLHAAAGLDFAGTAVLNNRIRDLKSVQDLLWEKHSIFLLLVMCPDKPSLYPEYIPNRYLRNFATNRMTNAQYISDRCTREGVHVIDFSAWFGSLKKNARYPLIPKTGIHWSFYGAYLAADSLSRYLSLESGYDVPRLILDSIRESGKPLAEDNDMAATLNLIKEIPSPVLGYPSFHGSFDPGEPRPSALFIGDSFYWNWFNGGIISTLFSNEDFWYYGRDVFPVTNQHQLSVSDIDARKIVLGQKFIILMQVNGGYGDIGFGFTETIRRILDPGSSKLLKLEQQMRSNPEWFEDIKQKAMRNKLSVDEQLRLDALWIINHEQQPSKTE